MNLDLITPVILTYNEEPNIGRTLERLSWARAIHVVDSYSTDGTLAILKADARARVFQRTFAGHAEQWNFAVSETGIATPWVLALDADHLVSDQLAAEIRELADRGEAGFRISYTYSIYGRRLPGSLYPPAIALFRRERGHYMQDGHTQRLQLEGTVRELRGRIEHDDRKPTSAWFAAQARYAQLEAEKLARTPFGACSWTGRIRKLIVVAPVASLFYCLVLKGGLFSGWAGWFYAYQRCLAEVMIALSLLERHLGRRTE